MGYDTNDIGRKGVAIISMCQKYMDELCIYKGVERLE